VEENQYLALMSYSVSSDFDTFYLQEVQEKYIETSDDPQPLIDDNPDDWPDSEPINNSN
jgi:hypothetical protein